MEYTVFNTGPLEGHNHHSGFLKKAQCRPDCRVEFRKARRTVGRMLRGRGFGETEAGSGLPATGGHHHHPPPHPATGGEPLTVLGLSNYHVTQTRGFIDPLLSAGL